MGLTTILRGFKVPISVLDRFFESNGVMQTWGYPPRYDRLPLPGSDRPTLDPQSAFLRTKLGVTRRGREGMSQSTHAYVAYAYLMVFAQRQIDVAAELPDTAPPGFARLRSEILEFATEGEEGLLHTAGMQGGEGQDPSSSLFIVVTDEREYPFKGPFMRESDLRCNQCAAVFEDWLLLKSHRKDAHGVEIERDTLPDDL
ncbi:uncharacterized protein B0H64DRAFT_403391 [Chaetomium fimeti]|uniref:C2H2-type domain-containing protein n=1 Tax=Chaetomium fimeti TaxID=1854472 RepID=A0AAE0HB19_9PEZI|nr:hypothetical protein B0H64DRAFT_403391 [Chaetomium fimeti]